MSLDDTKLLDVYNCKFVKEMWDTFKMIYGIYLSIEQKGMKHEANVSPNLERLVILLECLLRNYIQELRIGN